MTSRRDFLKTIITAAGMVTLHDMFSAQDILAAISPAKSLKLYNTLRYSSQGIWKRDDMERISYFLRCHYTNKVKPIPPRLVNLLCRVKERTAPSRQLHIISGYRSREYNEYLRRTGHQVATESLHLQGQAVDFIIPGVRASKISRTAKRLKAGGVGRYPDFVHVDIGRVRYW
jgi:uncharacterized protein YcbK (DUF882 family)